MKVSVAINRLYFASLLLFNVPLSMGVGYIRVYLWMIPFAIIFILKMCFQFQYKLDTHQRFYDRRLRKSKVGIIVALIVLTCATMLSPPSDISGWHGLFLVIISICFAYNYIKSLVKNEVSIKQFYSFAFLSILIQSSFGILQFITNTEIGSVKNYFGTNLIADQELVLEATYGRVKGTIGQANILGNYLVLLLPYVAFARYEQLLLPKQNRNIRLLLLMIGSFTLIATLSRGSILGLILQILLALLLRPKGNVSKIMLSGILLLSLIVVTFPFIDELKGFGSLVFARFSEVTNSDTNYRMEMMRGAWQYFINHPFDAIGYTNSRYIWSHVDTLLPAYWDFRPHNIFIVLLLEGSMIVFFLSLLWFWVPIRRFLHVYRHLNAFLFVTGLNLFVILLFFNLYLTPLSGDIMPLYFLVIHMGFIFISGRREV